MNKITVKSQAMLTDSQIQHEVKEILGNLLLVKANATGNVLNKSFGDLLNSILQFINEVKGEFDEQIDIFFEDNVGAFRENIVQIDLGNPNDVIPDSYINELITMKESINWLQIPFEEIDHWVEQRLLTPFTRNSRVYYTLGQLKDAYLKAYLYK